MKGHRKEPLLVPPRHFRPNIEQRGSDDAAVDDPANPAGLFHDEDAFAVAGCVGDQEGLLQSPDDRLQTDAGKPVGIDRFGRRRHGRRHCGAEADDEHENDQWLKRRHGPEC